MNNSDIITQTLTFLMLLVIVYFTYTIANIVVTIFRTRKTDESLNFCFNTTGKVFYGALAALYVVTVIGSIYFMATGLLTDHYHWYVYAVNAWAFMSVVASYFLSSLVMIGRKNLMVGRMVIDYRKLKKVNYSYAHKVSFVYAQGEYNFSTRFVDLTLLRKKISI